jgi:predicted nucleotidyltransferase
MDKQAKQELFADIVAFLKSRGATKVAVFGSYVRDEETPGSDIDLLVDFDKPITLFDFVGYQQDLEDRIGVKVDLVMDGSLNPLIEKYVNQDLLVLYQ